MYALVLGIHLIVCLCLIGIVLIQSGKGGGLAGGAFGGATQTVFGGRGATDFITRATVILGVVFFATSLVLALMTAHGGLGAKANKSLLQEAARKAAAGAPAQAPRNAGSPAPQGRPAAPAPAPASR